MRNASRWLLALLLPCLPGCDSGAPPGAPLAPSARSLAALGEDDSAVLFIGNLVAGVPGGNSVLRYDASGTFIDRFAPSGCCMTFGPDENLYLIRQSSIQRVNGVTGAFIDVVVPGDPTGRVINFIPMFGPDGNLYVSDRGVGRAIRRYLGTTGVLDPTFFVDGAAQAMGTSDPQFYAFGPDGNLYVTSIATHRVLRFSGTNGAYIDDFASAHEGGLDAPSGIAFGPDGTMYVGSTTTDRVLRYDRNGDYIGDFVAAGSGGLDNPVGLTFGPGGDLYVASAASPATAGVLRYDGVTGAFIGAVVGPGDGITTGPRAILFKSTIAMCHTPKGNPEGRHTIHVAYLSGMDHVNHGDPVGPCS
jgi:streptogramin lyase